MAEGLTDAFMGNLSGVVRKATVNFTLGGTDVTSVFVPSLISLTYKESYKDDQVSDTIELELADPEALFRLTFSLATAQAITVSISMTNWNGPDSGTIVKDCGTIYITAIQMHSDKGKGTTIRITCSSIAPNTSMRLEKRSRAWGPITCSKVVDQIAADNGWTPKYTPTTDPVIDRADQHDHSDSYMLRKICSENDFSFKIINGTLWVRDNEVVEAQAPIGTIVCPTTTSVGGLNGSGITSWEFRQTTEDCSYASAKAAVKDNRTGKTVTETATNPNAVPNPVTDDRVPILIHHEDLHTSPTQAQEGTTTQGTGD